MSSTRIRCHVNAPRARVYRALLDARAVAMWMVPTGMASHVHAFDAREGGAFRISLTYDSPDEIGKTTGAHRTSRGIPVATSISGPGNAMDNSTFASTDAPGASLT